MTCTTLGRPWLRLAGALLALQRAEHVEGYLTLHQNTQSDLHECRNVVLTPTSVIP